MNEYIVGYDIRYHIEDELVKKTLLSNFSYITYPKSFSRSLWPSRFRRKLKSDPISDPLKTNFRAPSDIGVDGKFIVYNEYSETFFYSCLWENLGNMLLYYIPSTGVDVITAFTFCVFDSPKILANDINSYDKVNIFESTIYNSYYLYHNDTFSPKKLNKKQWKFVGYDVSNGFSILEYGKEFIDKIKFSPKRNQFGLIENFDEALDECINLNEKEPEHDAWLIFGIYEATDWNNLDFV